MAAAVPNDDDLELDSPTAQDGHVDLCVELPGSKTQGQGFVSIVRTDPFSGHNECEASLLLSLH